MYKYVQITDGLWRLQAQRHTATVEAVDTGPQHAHNYKSIGMDFKFCTIKRAFHKLVLFLSDVRVYRLPAGCPHSLGARASVHAT